MLLTMLLKNTLSYIFVMIRRAFRRNPRVRKLILSHVTLLIQLIRVDNCDIRFAIG